MTLTRILCLALAVTVVPSCGLFQGGDKETVEIRSEGAEPGAEEVRRVRIRASLDRGKDRREFTVRVSPFLSVSEQALASARHRATSYCLENYGGSNIAWTIGPDQPIEELVVDADSVTLAGRCTQR